MDNKKTIYQDLFLFHTCKKVITIKQELNNWLKVSSDLQDKNNSKSTILIILCLLSFILFLLVVVQNYSMKVILLVILSVFGLSTFVGFIFTKFKAIKYNKIFKNQYRTELSQKLIDLLSRDIDEQSIIEFKLSYKYDKDKINKLYTLKHPHKSGWKIDHYRHEWLSFRGKFIDKNNFYLTIAKLSKTAYGTKRSSSGKIKNKSKDKDLGLELSLICKYSQKRYGAIKLLKDDFISALKIPSECKTRKIRLTDKAIIWVVRISPQFSNKVDSIYQAIMMMFLSLYQVLNLAKKLTKSSKI